MNRFVMNQLVISCTDREIVISLSMWPYAETALTNSQAFQYYSGILYNIFSWHTSRKGISEDDLLQIRPVC